MNLKALQQLWHKRPFTPFRLKLADGTAYSVGHPEHLWITEVLVGVKNGREAVLCAPEHIVTAKVLKRLERS
jgi:hypothetical protein